MFTGIITDLGEVVSFQKGRLEIRTAYDLSPIPLGASIACDGACLTVIEKKKDILSFDVSEETLSKTTLGQWQPGRKVNLERPVQAGGEFGGHFVTGHVDTTGSVQTNAPHGDFLQLAIAFPPSLRPYFAAKGSVTVNGVSLTVNAVENDCLSLTLIPHTAAVTNLGALKPGDAVNLEVDLIARYIAPYLQQRAS